MYLYAILSFVSNPMWGWQLQLIIVFSYPLLLLLYIQHPWCWTLWRQWVTSSTLLLGSLYPVLLWLYWGQIKGTLPYSMANTLSVYHWNLVIEPFPYWMVNTLSVYHWKVILYYIYIIDGFPWIIICLSTLQVLWNLYCTICNFFPSEVSLLDETSHFPRFRYFGMRRHISHTLFPKHVFLPDQISHLSYNGFLNHLPSRILKLHVTFKLW